MNTLDLLVVGGNIVSSVGRKQVNLGVVDGQVAYLGPERLRARETIDAGGRLLLPGGVDTHVHLMDPGSPEREDFPTGTGAAAASGVTTIIEHSHGEPVRTLSDLQAKKDYLAGRSVIDFGLAAHAWPRETSNVATLWHAGVSFFKVFTCTTHGIPGHNSADLKAHFDASAMVGAISLMHCEDEDLTASAEAVLRNAGRLGGDILSEWRSLDAEVVAASVAALLARRAGARAVVAHVSHPEVADYILRERRAGADLFAESCPQYFLLREHESQLHGALRKFTPPARARSDEDEADMWRLLRTGALTHISSDHAPSTLEQKSAGDIWNVHFGLPGLDSTMALLIDAANGSLFSYEDVVRVYCERPAKIYGLWPRKGRLGIGSDADFVLIDPHLKRTLSNEQILSKAGWTPYDGRTVTGGVTHTYSRGVLVAQDGAVVRPGLGQFLDGAGSCRGGTSS